MSFCYPIYLNLEGKKCIVIGGGKVAQRKVKALIDCNANVHVISPVLTRWLEDAAGDGIIALSRKNYDTSDLDGAFLVIGATDDKLINERVAEDCLKRNILVNIVDDPEKCNFIVPAVLRRGSLSISVSTDGESPMLARRIREELENIFGPEYSEFSEIMGDIRKYVIANVPDENSRRKIFKELVYSDIIDLLKLRQYEIVKERINHVLGNGWTKSQDSSGCN